MTAPRPDLAGRTRAPEFLTVHEVAAAWRVSPMTVYRLVHDGALASVRVGPSFRIPADAADRLRARVAADELVRETEVLGLYEDGER